MTQAPELFDTHCHLQDAAFEGDAGAVVERAVAAGVTAMLVCAYDRDSIDGALGLAHAYDSVYAAAGIHPHDADQLDEATLARLRWAAVDDRCVAIGEIGLDHYRDLSPRDVQLAALERQLELAVEFGLPVSVHSRDAEETILAPLATHAARSPLAGAGRPVGVMHCFAGTVDLARRFVDLGFLISIPCTITYPNNRTGRALATSLPLDSLVVETDAPYLPPQSIRGKRNEPAKIVQTVQAIAECRSETFERIAAATTANAMRAFGVRATAGAPR